MLIKIPQEPKQRVTPISAAQEAAMDRKMDQHFRSQRELPNGRHFRWDTYRFITEDENKSYRENFDQIKWDQTPPGQGL